MDREYKETKLNGWEEIGLEHIQVGDHMRVTSNRYQEPGRKCSHVVVQNINDQGIFVNSYGNNKKFDNWQLKPGCVYKQQKYYKRKDLGTHDGKCVRCREAIVKLPFWICVYCRNNPVEA